MTTQMRRHRVNRKWDSERGSISAWMALAATAMIILAGLAVDLGGQVYTRQHAIDIATQAARTGGEQLHTPTAIRGDTVRTDPARAVAAARAYLAASDVTGTVQLRGGTVVVVTTTAHYDTIFLGIIGLDRISVTGTAESRTVRAFQGNER